MYEALALTPFVGPGDHESLNRSFNFTKLPNIQEVTFTVRRIHGDILWIHKALSTLKPSTSPRLSAVRLKLGSKPPEDSPVHVRELPDRVIRPIEEQVARIELEYTGTVDVTVQRYPRLEVGVPTFSVHPLLTDPSELIENNLIRLSLLISVEWFSHTNFYVAGRSQSFGRLSTSPMFVVDNQRFSFFFFFFFFWCSVGTCRVGSCTRLV